MYLIRNYKKEVDPGEIASPVNVAKGSLSRFFRESAECTPFEYLNRIKTDIACKFLMN